MNFKRYGSVAAPLLALSALIGINSAIAQELRWKTVMGINQTGDQVGVGTGAVLGGAPWETTGGSVNVDLNNGKVTFKVTGLILSIGSAPSLGITGVPIGTPGPVTRVRGNPGM